jgi:flagellar FliJ protein
MESVLNYRRNLEEQAITELRQAQTALEQEERRLNLMESVWRKSAEDLKKQQSTVSDPREILLYHHFLQQMALEIEAQQHRMAEVVQEYNGRREILLAAATEKKIMEKLKEKQEELMKTEAKKQDRKAMDESAAGGHARDGSY